MSSGVLFSIDNQYNIDIQRVTDFEESKCLENQFFMSDTEVDTNQNGYLREGEQILIAKLRRKKVMEDLAKLGFKAGCDAPKFAYYIVYGQPNVRNTPPSVYYEIEQTFEDMGWSFTGCPHENI